MRIAQNAPNARLRDRSGRSGFRLDLLLALTIFFLALWQYSVYLEDIGFHVDESRWLNRAHYIRDIADPFGATWQDRYLIRGQPPLGSYVMGLGLALQGRDLDTNGAWDFHHGHDWNIAHGNMPSQADLSAGRRTNAVIGALAVVVVYFLGKRLTNRVGGVVGATFLIAHPLQIWHNNLALADTIFTLLLAVAALVACRLADRPRWTWAILLGVVLGLAASAKLSPLLLSVPLAGLGALLLLREVWRNRHRPPLGVFGWRFIPPPRRLGWMLVSLPLVSYATFVASYPYLWPNPIGRTINLFEFRRVEMADQARIFPTRAIDNPIEALQRIGNILGERFSASAHLASFVGAGASAQDQIAWYVGGPAASSAVARLDLILAAIGLAFFVGLAWRYGVSSRYTMTLTLLGAQTMIIVLTMRANFERYHLPIVVGVVACIGLLAGLGWDLISRSIAQRRSVVRTQRAGSPTAPMTGATVIEGES